MWFLPLCQLIFTAAQLIWTQHCIGLEKLPQFDLSYVKFPGVYLNFTFIQLICAADLDLPWKTSPIWPLICETPWCVSQFYLYVSWFVQLISWVDIITGLALKNYPNLTFNMWNSLVCISILSSCQLICTADQLIWHHHLICLKKLPQFDL